MPDVYSIISCSILALLTWWYSLILRRLRERYEQRWTWLTVVGGTSIVGLMLLLRLMLLPIPDSQGIWLLFWGWFQGFFHFLAGGLPVIWWQISEDRDQLERAYQSRFKVVRRRTDSDEGGSE